MGYILQKLWDIFAKFMIYSAKLLDILGKTFGIF